MSSDRLRRVPEVDRKRPRNAVIDDLIASTPGKRRGHAPAFADADFENENAFMIQLPFKESHESQKTSCAKFEIEQQVMSNGLD